MLQPAAQWLTCPSQQQVTKTCQPLRITVQQAQKLMQKRRLT